MTSKKGIDRKLQTEMLIVRLCTPSLSTDNTSILRRISDLEAGTHFQRPATPTPTIKEQTSAPVVQDISEEKAVEKASEETSNSDILRFKSWPEVLGILKDTCKPISGLLSGSTAYTQGDKLFIKTENAALVQFLKIPLYSNAISDAIIKSCGNKYTVSIFDNKTEKAQDPLANLVKKIDDYKKKEND